MSYGQTFAATESRKLQEQEEGVGSRERFGWHLRSCWGTSACQGDQVGGGWSAAFPKRPWKVRSTVRSGSGQRRRDKHLEECRRGKKEERKCSFPDLTR